MSSTVDMKAALRILPEESSRDPREAIRGSISRSQDRPTDPIEAKGDSKKSAEPFSEVFSAASGTIPPDGAALQEEGGGRDLAAISAPSGEGEAPETPGSAFEDLLFGIYFTGGQGWMAGDGIHMDLRDPADLRDPFSRSVWMEAEGNGSPGDLPLDPASLEGADPSFAGKSGSGDPAKLSVLDRKGWAGGPLPPVPPDGASGKGSGGPATPAPAPNASEPLALQTGKDPWVGRLSIPEQSRSQETAVLSSSADGDGASHPAGPIAPIPGSDSASRREGSAEPAPKGDPSALLDLADGRDRWAARLAQAIRSQIRAGGSQLRMVLKPPRLGNIELQFSMRGSTLRLGIDVDSNSTRHLLSAGLGDLRENLRQAGVDLEKVRITVNEREGRGGNQGEGQPGGDGGGSGYRSSTREAREGGSGREFPGGPVSEERELSGLEGMVARSAGLNAEA